MNCFETEKCWRNVKISIFFGKKIPQRKNFKKSLREAEIFVDLKNKQN